MLRTVKVYGHLAEHCGQSVFEALVRAPADAIKFLLCNFPELRGLMRDGYYKVAVGSHDLQIADCPEQLHFPLADDDVVKVIPVVSGAGGGVGKVLAGAALITAAILLAPAAAAGGGFLVAGAAGTTMGALGVATTVAGSIGLSLALGGVAQLISPVPDLPSFDGGDFGGGEDLQNLAFQSIGNVDREGVPVPVVYGEMIVGSVVISTDIIAKQIEG